MAVTTLEELICQNCAKWKLLTDEEREWFGIPEYVSVGRCAVGQQMTEDFWPCRFMRAFTPIYEQTCDTCADTTCQEHGKKNQGCVKWQHQLAKALVK